MNVLNRILAHSLAFEALHLLTDSRSGVIG
jgi:hypothetical protein